MTKNGLIADEQHGFVAYRNRMTNLLTAIEDWRTMIHEGRVFDIIYTDFSNAFDSMPHARLITKLKALGIRDDILGWIESFLTNRKQKVIVEGETSTWSEVMSGVPQGSALGPILFVVFINDMPKSLSSVCKMFTDDAKVYREVNCTEDCESLQLDLDIMSEWPHKWQLPFNETKCKCMYFGTPKMKYTMKNHILEESSEERDLGVIIDDSLKFRRHAAEAVKKANTVLGIIKNSFITLDTRTLPLLYKYGNVLWIHLHYLYYRNQWRGRI